MTIAEEVRARCKEYAPPVGERVTVIRVMNPARDLPIGTEGVVVSYSDTGLFSEQGAVVEWDTPGLAPVTIPYTELPRIACAEGIYAFGQVIFVPSIAVVRSELLLEMLTEAFSEARRIWCKGVKIVGDSIENASFAEHVMAGYDLLLYVRDGDGSPLKLADGRESPFKLNKEIAIAAMTKLSQQRGWTEQGIYRLDEYPDTLLQVALFDEVIFG
jgi:hypothetical protein